MINEIFKNTQGHEFKIISLDRIDEKHKKYYTIEFIETGFKVSNVRTDTIKSGKVRDKLKRTVCNIGIVGYANTRENEQEYKIWHNMLDRCYNPNSKSYKYYGEKGVTVDSRWHRFDYFLKDIPNIEGYNKELFHQRQLKLDKDIKSKDAKIYSIGTCLFVSDMINQQQRTKEQNLKNLKVAIFPDGHEEIIKHMGKFCEQNNLHRSNVGCCLRKEQESTKGFRFYYKKAN